MGNLAIIPARSGSKRIKDKNIKDFCGTPLLKTAIEKALSSGLFETVHVSTDSKKYAELATSWGADVSFLRSEKTADDFATTMDVLKETIDAFETQGKIFENICCLYATSAFTRIQHLTESFDVLKSGHDSVYTVAEFDFPIQRAFRINNSKIEFAEPKHSNSRSQDLEKMVHDAGQFYWMTNRTIKNCTSVMTNNTSFYEINRIYCQDIDTPEDWDVAEFKFEYLTKKGLI